MQRRLKDRLARYAARMSAVLIACVAFGASAAEEREFPGVQALMSDENFQRAGLHRLSADELQALNAWLIDYTATEAETLSEVVPEIKKIRDKPIVSEIVGEFDGWRGRTIFRLANGQVWRQRVDGYFRYREDEPAVAVITRNAMGFHTLKLEGFRRGVGVERVR